MDAHSPPALFERLRALPAAAPLLARLGGSPGVHVVGGAVRDLLLDGAPVDLDLVVEGDAGALAAGLGGELRRHHRFGSATVVLEGRAYDIACARRERYPRPGALPEVAPASLAVDLRRRDFTVNAAAIGLGGADAGALRAAPGALEDLAAGRLRILHWQSFVDDPTRLVRLVRYRSRLRFDLEARTEELARRAVAEGALATISGSRLGAELRLLAREPDPVDALRGLAELGIDSAIARDFGLRDPSLARRAIALLPADGRPDLLVLAVAARALSGRRLADLLDELAFERTERDAILATATRAGTVARSLESAACASQRWGALAGGPPELAALAGALGPAPQASEWLGRLRHVRLEIGGADLLEAGVPEGPAVGRGLRAALEAKLDGRVTGARSELAEALRGAL